MSSVLEKNKSENVIVGTSPAVQASQVAQW